MGRTASPGSTGEIFAPLLGQSVACSTLQIGRYDGSRIRAARDAAGKPIQVPVDAGMTELRERICEPGRYRVAARDAETNDYLAFSDYTLTPLDESESDDEWEVTEPMPERSPRSTPWREVSEHAYVGHLHDTINNLRDQLREAASRAERDIRYERERADTSIKAAQERATADVKAAQERATADAKAAQERADEKFSALEARSIEEVRALREKHETVAKQAFDANVKLSAYVARLEGREQRIDDLEAKLAEMQEEVENARELAAELKLQSEGTGFDPIAAFMQMDQALDMAAKTAARFKDD